MKIVISGGTGFIGKKFIESAFTKVHEIIVLSRSEKKSDWPAHVRVVQWDGKTVGEWVSALDGADVVINLAGDNIGSQRWSEEKKKKILESRINSGRVLTEAVQWVNNKPSLFIQASAIGIYGTDNEKIFDETSLPGKGYLAEVGKTWENPIRSVKVPGMRRIIARIGIVLDREVGALPKMIQPINLFAGGPLGNGQQWISWIHIDDVIKALQYFITHKECSGVYNLTSPNPVRNHEFGKQIALILQKPFWLPTPGFILRFLLGEMSTLVLDGQNVIPKRLLADGFQFQYALHTKALEDLLL